jgi:hypothetical protein
LRRSIEEEDLFREGGGYVNGKAIDIQPKDCDFPCKSSVSHGKNAALGRRS